MSAEPDGPAVADDEDGPARWVLLSGLGVLLLALLVVALVTSLRSTREPGEQALVASALRTSEPSPSATPAAVPSATESPAAMPTATTEPASPSPSPTRTSPTGRSPTAADAAGFARSFLPIGAQSSETLTVDLDDDGVDEVVVASVVERTSRLDVARWDGRSYRVVFTGSGGAAERIAGLHAADVTGGGTREVWISERTGELGASVSMWGIGQDGMTPLRAAGGCADGRHTYGVVGAEVAPGEIRATCDAEPLPPDRWPVDVYRWDGDRWTWQLRLGEEPPG